MNNDIILNIEQFDIEAVKEISRKENPTMPNSNGLMYYQDDQFKSAVKSALLFFNEESEVINYGRV